MVTADGMMITNLWCSKCGTMAMGCMPSYRQIFFLGMVVGMLLMYLIIAKWFEKVMTKPHEHWSLKPELKFDFRSALFFGMIIVVFLIIWISVILWRFV